MVVASRLFAVALMGGLLFATILMIVMLGGSGNLLAIPFAVVFFAAWAKLMRGL